jgi:hypothetical protein
MTPATDDVRLETLTRERNGDMLKILSASPIETPWLTVGFERAPDIFALPELFSDRVAWMGALKAGALAGFAMLAAQTRYVGGRPRRVLYFGNAHVRPGDRGRGFLSRIADRLFREREEGADIGYAIVMTGNRAAERFIGRRPAGCPDFPASRPIGDLCARNILILGPKRESRAFHVRRATAADVDAMVSLLREEYRPRLFGPLIDRDTFLRSADERPGCGIEDHYVAERDGGVVGTCAAWDMERLRQTRIIRYGAKLALARKGLALLAPWTGSPAWPRAGERVRDVTITDCAVRGRDPEVLEALLGKISNDLRAKGYHMMTVGSSRRDPLLRAARRFAGTTVVSNVVCFAKDPSLLAEDSIDVSLPFVDLAMI